LWTPRWQKLDNPDVDFDTMVEENVDGDPRD
jgi:hypothetical protein